MKEIKDITKDQWASLFNELHPGYFERDYVKRVADDEPASEMFLGFIVLLSPSCITIILWRIIYVNKKSINDTIL